jgi:hypothetical protein
MALSGDRIVTGDASHVIRVFNVSTCLFVLSSCYDFFLSYDTVEMVKQFLEARFGCNSLSFHNDFVYIGSYSCVIQWKVATDAVAIFDGYPCLIFQRLFICFAPHCF